MYWGNPTNPDMLATTAQLEVALAPALLPDNAKAYLQAATRLVLEESAGAFYSVDTTTGMATDAGIALALANATIAQVQAWIALGIDPSTGGVYTASVKSSAKIGTASFTLADAGEAVQARKQALTHLVPNAVVILQQANLQAAGPWSFG